MAAGQAVGMPNLTEPTAADVDVVSLLKRQHAQIEGLLATVADTTGTDRQSAFDDLREILARHETGEEMILRPLTRRAPGGKEIAQSRMDEENEAKEVLANLEKMHVDSEDFTTTFAQFRISVLDHAHAEEAKEFPAIESGIGLADREKALDRLWKAEKTAPTHPHPSARTTAANYVAGPFAAMLDRARDALNDR